MQTEVGNIHADIQAAAEEDSDTPLKRKLNAFGESLAMVRLPTCPSFNQPVKAINHSMPVMMHWVCALAMQCYTTWYM